MNRLVIIGNGFDMAHGLKTSYKEFINWYWDQRFDGLVTNSTKYDNDSLCELQIIASSGLNHWMDFARKYRNILNGEKSLHGIDVYNVIKNDPFNYSLIISPFFEQINNSIEKKGWVDIENEYYAHLKYAIKAQNCSYSVEGLNKQLKLLQEKLVEYLKLHNNASCQGTIHDKITSLFKLEDFSSKDKNRVRKNIEATKHVVAETLRADPVTVINVPKKILLLNFNYTNTAFQYNNFNIVDTLYIHGSLDNPNNIIFGYGDELDKDFKDIVDKNDNELLTNVKSVKYLETDNYKKMLNFIESEPFQVFIMGHSCGNSDRTLLNTIFEHENCVSIKPFYYKKVDGTDNYLELVQNIYRNFTDLKLYRDRVVNKTQCEPLT